MLSGGETKQFEELLHFALQAVVLVLQRLFLECAGHFSPSDLPGRPKTCGIPEGRKQRGAVVLGIDGSLMFRNCLAE